MWGKRREGVYVGPLEDAFNRFLTPLEEFIHRQTTSGVLLMICTVVALGIANSPLFPGYQHFLHTMVGFRFAGENFELTIHHWINDGLMAAFFFVMGLELKREFLAGELSNPKKAFVPIAAAIGGMAMPATIYALFNSGTPHIKGWGIPMATDIAFAIGALSLFGKRVPQSLLTFLIALAIVDDLGAVAVIAIFYTASINVPALFASIGLGLFLLALNMGGVRRPLPYLLVGILLWSFMLVSGIHATIAGVVLAFAIPLRPKYPPMVLVDILKSQTEKLEESQKLGHNILRSDHFRSLVSGLSDGIDKAQAPAQRLEHRLHLWVAYLIIPIFALANAGIPIGNMDLGVALTHPVTLGIVFGLVFGKLMGITGGTWVAVRMGIAKLPEELTMKHLIAVSFLGGIGFTMSIFIADLGFKDSPETLVMAKAGIILASLIAGLTGSAILYKVTQKKA